MAPYRYTLTGELYDDDEIWIFFAFSMVVHGDRRIYIGRNEPTLRTCRPVHHHLTPRTTVSAEVDL